jgi:hypothetical protein
MRLFSYLHVCHDAAACKSTLHSVLQVIFVVSPLDIYLFFFVILACLQSFHTLVQKSGEHINQ